MLFLLLTLNIFHTFFSVFIDFKHEFVCWVIVILVLLLLFAKCATEGISSRESSASNKWEIVTKHEKIVKLMPYYHNATPIQNYFIWWHRAKFEQGNTEMKYFTKRTFQSKITQHHHCPMDDVVMWKFQDQRTNGFM